MALLIEEGPHIANYVEQRVMGGIPIGECHGIGTSENGFICGGVLFHMWNGPNVFMHCSSEGKRWITKSYIFRVFDFAFKVLNVNRITGMVSSSNSQAINFNKHVGFEHECTLKNADPTGNIEVYVMWKDTCKWVSRTKV